jgi:hypothetical protein
MLAESVLAKIASCSWGLNPCNRTNIRATRALARPRDHSRALKYIEIAAEHVRLHQHTVQPVRAELPTWILPPWLLWP